MAAPVAAAEELGRPEGLELRPSPSHIASAAAALLDAEQQAQLAQHAQHVPHAQDARWAHGAAAEPQARPSEYGAWRSPAQRSTSIWRVQRPPGTHGHRIPGSQYFALLVWLSLLLVQYALVRAVCVTQGIPEDCRTDQSPVQIMADFQYLLSMGFVLAVLTGMHWPDRFAYVFAFRWPKCRGPAFLLLFFSMGPAYGALNQIPWLGSFSLTTIQRPYIVLCIALLGGAAALLLWHVWVAFRHNSLHGFLAYALSRSALVAFFAGYLIVKSQHQDVEFHFHHYALGFIVASLAEFNHPLSLVVLACGTAIFVQGIAAYGADEIIYYDQGRVAFQAGGREYVSPAISGEAAVFFKRHCRWAP